MVLVRERANGRPRPGLSNGLGAREGERDGPRPGLCDGLGAREDERRRRGDRGARFQPAGAFAQLRLSVRPSMSLRTNGRSKPRGKRGCWCAGGRTDGPGLGYAMVLVPSATYK